MKKVFNNKLTKIVATIGPATESEEMLKQIIEQGMNVARFNTKHGTPEWHHERILRVRKVAQELNQPVGILLDLQGPEIRINLPQEKSIEFKEGDKVAFSAYLDTALPDLDSSISGQTNLAQIPQNVIDLLEPGLLILIDDGLCQFEVTSKHQNYVEAVALDQFTLKHRKSMSIPGVVTDMPVLIDNDYVQLDGIQDDEVDYVALSFVRNKEDIEILRSELEKRSLTAGIVSKIENQAALDNLDEIIDASDAIMIARGDLGVEVPFEELIFWQRKMIEKCRQAAKPVITATHMLETMIDKPLPTRAEISDVAHAIYDQTDAIMLSGETTIGQFPVRAVQTQARIAAFNEKQIEPDPISVPETDRINIADAVNCLALRPLNSIQPNIDKIICLTETGRTASLISRNRLKIPVHVITSTKRCYHKLTLHFGLIPHLVDWPKDEYLVNAQQVIDKLGPVDWLQPGEKVLVLHGPQWGKSGHTNTISYLEIV
ncbi:MAG: pyruvate kinase [Candidatus Pacebacteria bacterium]|nr:pyruvate kinase [Candidatus Paceibacterota bacterium]